MSFGARAELPSKATAVRVPVPVITKTIALPEIQPGRFVISCTMLARFGVRWLGPASLAMFQAAGAQGTVAVVRGRLEMLLAVPVNVTALSLAWPANESWVAAEVTSSVANCTYADVMVAPGGIVRFTNRSPTT